MTNKTITYVKSMRLTGEHTHVMTKEQFVNVCDALRLYNNLVQAYIENGHFDLLTRGSAFTLFQHEYGKYTVISMLDYDATVDKIFEGIDLEHKGPLFTFHVIYNQ